MVIHRTSLIDAPIHSDGYSYYVYLPAILLNHDPSLQTVADDCCGGAFPAFTSIVRWPGTREWVNPHPIGAAVLMAPLFTLSHALTRWSNLPPDGFSLYYQHGAGLSGLAAFLGGLLFLQRFLRRHFTDAVVLATLACLTLGTNLFHYGTYDSTFSHAFSFLLIAALLDAIDRWWRENDLATSMQLAIIAALIVLTRHTNAIYLIVLPLWNPRGVWTRRRRLLLMAAVAAACITPQLALYHRATGHWFVSVYGQLGAFDFRSPRLLSALFSTEKGLFFWSPLLLLAVAGLFTPHPLARRLRSAAAITFAATAFLIGSWIDWQFGASFGHRGFTDGLPIAAVYLAAIFAAIADRPRVAVPVGVAAALLAALSTAQMIQYWLGILPIANTTWDQYRSVFLRF